jgi:hypothetical protein
MKKSGVNGLVKPKKTVAEPPAAKKIAQRTDIPIEHVLPDGQQAIYANNFAIQHENGIYHLMFFQVNPPLAVGTHEEKAKILRSVRSVKGVCAARIVVGAEVLPGIIRAMVENLQTQQAMAAGQVEIINVNSDVTG